MQTRTTKTISEIIAAMLILLFTYTAISKWQTRLAFEVVISKSPLLSWTGNILTWLIPLIEMIIVILLIIPKTKTVGLFAATILMVSFTGYIAVMLLTENKLPCSCGGVLKELSWLQHLIFNVAFSLLSLVAWALHRKPNALLQ